MIYLMLHDDWEIYGDGTGDPEIIMFEPARRMLDICDNYGAKYTFYAEIGQQISMLNSTSAKWRQYANKWEEVLKDAVKRGHDVQLHFHPQWIDAYLIDDKWKLDFLKSHCGNVDEAVIDHWIGKGKQYLEQLLRTINHEYKVNSFRAGGCKIQPSIYVYRALRKHDISCDVSVLKGRYKIFEDGTFVDFRKTVSLFEPWEVDPDDFAKEKKGSGFWEIPIYRELTAQRRSVYLLRRSFRPFYYYKINNKLKKKNGGGQHPPKIIERDKLRGHHGDIGHIHYAHLRKMVNLVKNNVLTSRGNKHLIFLTHSKSILDFDNFEKLLQNLLTDSEVSFITTGDYIEKVILNADKNVTTYTDCKDDRAYRKIKKM